MLSSPPGSARMASNGRGSYTGTKEYGSKGSEDASSGTEDNETDSSSSNDYGNKGNKADSSSSTDSGNKGNEDASSGTEDNEADTSSSNDSSNKGNEDANSGTEDNEAGSSSSNSEEVAEDDEYYEQEPQQVVIQEAADSEFYDFDMDKCEESFAAGQIWAIYDYFDDMPRFYARIDKVYSPFKVDLTWLVFVPGDINETAWKASRLPVACGNFKLGKTATIEDIRAFSHKIFWRRSSSKSYNVYPRRGETWALYKNWNIKWNSDPDNHREYEYEFFIVLSDYTNESGISVAHLAKLKGFVCLFKPTKDNFQIPSNEMLIFSHRVPSCRTNGKERRDVPEGCFELDPCSLPSNLQELDTGANDYVNTVKEDAIISTEDIKDDSSNSYAEEVAEDDGYCEQEMVIQVANSDFYDFDWNKSVECFAVDQIWAIFDNLDGMPRFYARINKIHSPFKVDLTWLDFVAGDISETAWERSGLPVACGKFKHSKTATIEDVGSFSHKVFRKRRVNETYNIYPRKGETWALYKNWNIKWSSDPENHREYEYEFIVVLSDYNRESGILVGHLVKLKGFVCLFKPTKNNGIMASFQIPSNEMFRFSHRVPSFRTNGKERKGVPEGYYELDPCSLPCDLEEDSGFIDMEPETVDGNIHGSVKSVSKEKHPMLKKRKNPDAESTLDGSSAGENKSSRMSNGCYKNSNKEKQAAEASGRLLDKCKATNISDVKNNVASHAKEMSPDSVNTIPGSVDDDVPSSPSSLKTFTMPDTEFCKFGEEQSCGKFKTGHIWALYSKLDNFPRNYAQIESVESLPVFKLAVKWLISCDPPRGVIPWADKEMPVSCGTFKVTSGQVVVFENSISFSHQLSELPTVNNVYNIHPRPGEVWALYSKYRSDLTCSDLKKCKYNIVEILEVVGVRWIIVSILERVTSFKTVFKAVERERLDSIVVFRGLNCIDSLIKFLVSTCQKQGMASYVAAGNSILDH